MKPVIVDRKHVNGKSKLRLYDGKDRKAHYFSAGAVRTVGAWGMLVVNTPAGTGCCDGKDRAAFQPRSMPAAGRESVQVSAADKPICNPDYNGQVECVRIGPKGSVFVQNGIIP